MKELEESKKVRTLEWNAWLGKELKELVGNITATRFATNNIKHPVKLKRKDYISDLKVCWQHGTLNSVETILNQYKAGDYKTMDELVWDLVTVMKYSHDDLRNYHSMKSTIPNNTLTELWEHFQPKKKGEIEVREK